MLSVSSKEWIEGEMVAIMHVFVFPPNESRNNLVNLLSLSSNIGAVHLALFNSKNVPPAGI